MGYQPPKTGPPGPDAGAPEAQAKAGGSGSRPQGCAIEEVAAMARVGFTDERIEAACAAGSVHEKIEPPD